MTARNVLDCALQFVGAWLAKWSVDEVTDDVDDVDDLPCYEKDDR